MGYVYAACTCSARNPLDGSVERIHEGEVWDADAAFVKARPELFVSEPPGRIVRGRVRQVVETATAEPGKRRRTGSEQ